MKGLFVWIVWCFVLLVCLVGLFERVVWLDCLNGLFCWIVWWFVWSDNGHLLVRCWLVSWLVGGVLVSSLVSELLVSC